MSEKMPRPNAMSTNLCMVLNFLFETYAFLPMNKCHEIYDLMFRFLHFDIQYFVYLAYLFDVKRPNSNSKKFWINVDYRNSICKSFYYVVNVWRMPILLNFYSEKSDCVYLIEIL